jgi:hypothetical protein
MDHATTGDRVMSRRNEAIVRLYVAGASLREVGRVHEISYEYVRKIIVNHERRSGEIIERHTNTDAQFKSHSHPVIWRCSDCGTERSVIPSKAKLLSARCITCHHKLRRKILSDDLIERTIELVMSGTSSIYHEARCAGYGKSNTHALTQAIYVHLRRQDRTQEIAALWPRGIPRWLCKRSD